MPNIQYKEINFRQSSLDLIKLVNQANYAIMELTERKCEKEVQTV